MFSDDVHKVSKPEIVLTLDNRIFRCMFDSHRGVFHDCRTKTQHFLQHIEEWWNFLSAWQASRQNWFGGSIRHLEYEDSLPARSCYHFSPPRNLAMGSTHWLGP